MQGHFLVLEVQINKVSFVLVNVYAPNEDSLGFFTLVFETIEKTSNCEIVIGGDFNLVMNPHLDRQGVNVHLYHSKAHATVKQFMENKELCDMA